MPSPITTPMREAQIRLGVLGGAQPLLEDNLIGHVSFGSVADLVPMPQPVRGVGGFSFNTSATQRVVVWLQVLSQGGAVLERVTATSEYQMAIAPDTGAGASMSLLGFNGTPASTTWRLVPNASVIVSPNVTINEGTLENIQLYAPVGTIIQFQQATAGTGEWSIGLMWREYAIGQGPQA